MVNHANTTKSDRQASMPVCAVTSAKGRGGGYHSPPPRKPQGPTSLSLPGRELRVCEGLGLGFSLWHSDPVSALLPAWG